MNVGAEAYYIINHGCKYVLFSGMGGVFQLAPKHHQAKVGSILWEKMSRLRRRGVVQSVIAIYNRFSQRKNEKRYINAIKRNPPIQILMSTHKAAQIYLSDELLKGTVLYTHAMDYDRYIEENRKRIDIARQYIVFCDTGLGAIDYDAVLNSYTRIKDKAHFLRQIESLLSRLEERYNLPTIVLGHPNTKIRL